MKQKSASMAKAWSVFAPVLLYYLANNLLVFILMWICQSVLPENGRNYIMEHSVSFSAVIKGIGMIISAGAVFLHYREKNKSIYGIKETLTITEVLKVILLGITGGLALNIWFNLLGFVQSSESYNQVAQTQFALPVILAVFLYGIISPIAEEWVFRGIVYGKMRKLYDFKIALIGSAVIFGAFHGNLVQGVYGTIMGIAAAWLYERYGKLAAAVMFHGAANAAVYLAVSIRAINQAIFSLVGGIGSLLLCICVLWCIWGHKEACK